MSQTVPQESPSEAEVVGRAIQALRERANLSQEELAERMGVSRQTISRYEGGRSMVLRSDVQRQIVEAIGMSSEDFHAELDNLVQLHPRGRGARAEAAAAEPKTAVARRFVVSVQGHPEIGEDGQVRHVELPPLATEDLSWLFSPSTEFLRLADGILPSDTFCPRLAVYDKSSWPRRGQGCVVETKDGELMPRLYQRRTEAGVVVRGGDTDEEQVIPAGKVRGVYAIRLYGD